MLHRLPSADAQAHACPDQITEESILAFSTGNALPAINESTTPPEVCKLYAVLSQKYSESISQVQNLLRSMNKAWVQASVIAHQFHSNEPVSPNGPTPNPVTAAASLSTLAPAGIAVPSSGASMRVSAPLQELSRAAIASLNRQNKQFMREVFDRHAEKLGFSAKALASSLHANDPTVFPAEVSDSDAAKKLKEVDTSNKGYANFEEFCQASKVSSDQVGGESPAEDLFKRFADVKGLSAKALMVALKEVDAPVLLSSEGSSPEQIFRRADANLSGWVELAELDPPFLPFIFAMLCSSIWHQVHSCSCAAR
jgi:hypothetical protein